MFAYSESIPQRPVTWIMVADGKEMRVYQCQRIRKIMSVKDSDRHDTETFEWELTPLPHMTQKAEPARDFDIGHDKRGSVFASGAASRHTVEPHIEVREEIARNFMRAAAGALRQAHRQKSFDQLIIAAPPRLLGELREYLDGAVTKNVIAELPKNLTQYGNHELLEHVRDSLPFPALAA